MASPPPPTLEFQRTYPRFPKGPSSIIQRPQESPLPSWRIVPLVASHSFDNFLHLTLRDFSLFFGTPFLVLCTIYNFLHFSQRFYSNRDERKGLDRDCYLTDTRAREREEILFSLLSSVCRLLRRSKEGRKEGDVIYARAE